MDRRTTFLISLLYLCIILVLGLIYFVHRDLLFFIPPAFGPILVGVPWFGALGAVLISLTGVFDHKRDWDNDLWPWHLSRPLIGIALAVVSVLMFQGGIIAIGSSPQNTNSPTKLVHSYYLLAFLVGYREETFRELIKRLVDAIFTSATTDGILPFIHAVNPEQAAHDHPTQLVITGSGFTSTQSVKFGNTASQQFTINSDGQLTVTTPTVVAGGNVPLTVTTKRGSATHPFTFT